VVALRVWLAGRMPAGIPMSAIQSSWSAKFPSLSSASQHRDVAAPVLSVMKPSAARDRAQPAFAASICMQCSG
jgi:hypothetical protein